jgi:hypothetical protein
MHKPMSDVTRGWLNFAAVVVALMGVAAGYFWVDMRVTAPAGAENYVQLRDRSEFIKGAVGIVSLVAPLVSIVLGSIPRVQFGAVAGLLSAAFTLIWVPMHTRACCGADVMRVIGILRSINSAQQAYSSSCARDKGFAGSLQTMTTPPPGFSPLLPPELSSGAWVGYRVTMQAGESIDFVACDGKPVVSSYFVEAHPIDSRAEQFSFATDERGTIYERRDGTIIQPGMAGAVPVQ